MPITRLIRFLLVVATIAATLGISTVAASDSIDLLLPVPQRSQLDGTVWAGSNCGPASLAMILEAFGDRTPNLKLRERANQLLGVSSPRTGTRIEHLATIAKEHGLEVRGPDMVVVKKDEKVYRRWTIDEARAEIRSGHPVLVQVWLPVLPNQKMNPVPTDHYIVLTGTVGESFIYNDPADSKSPGYQQKMTAEELTRAWRSSGAPFAGFSVRPCKSGVSLLPPDPVEEVVGDPVEPTEVAMALPEAMPEPAPLLAGSPDLKAEEGEESPAMDNKDLPGYSPVAQPHTEANETPAGGRGVPVFPMFLALGAVLALGPRLYRSRTASR